MTMRATPSTANQHVRNYPQTGHSADIAKPTRLTLTEFGFYSGPARVGYPVLTRLPLPWADRVWRIGRGDSGVASGPLWVRGRRHACRSRRPLSLHQQSKSKPTAEFGFRPRETSTISNSRRSNATELHGNTRRSCSRTLLAGDFSQARRAFSWSLASPPW